jgi:beta-lactamase class A
MRRLMVILILASLLVGAVAPASGGSGWKPRIGKAADYSETREGSVTFAVIGPKGRLFGHKVNRQVPAASVLKAMFMAAYLRHPDLRVITRG